MLLHNKNNTVSFQCARIIEHSIYHNCWYKCYVLEIKYKNATEKIFTLKLKYDTIAEATNDVNYFFEQLATNK